MYDEIKERIESVFIECPECEVIEDDQYTCTTCWCEGGNGKINVLDYIRDNQEILNKPTNQ